jgi:hypothetical protein
MGDGTFLVWDFDGTLAARPGNWTGALCEVVNRERSDLGVTYPDARKGWMIGDSWRADVQGALRWGCERSSCALSIPTRRRGAKR